MKTVFLSFTLLRCLALFTACGAEETNYQHETVVLSLGERAYLNITLQGQTGNLALRLINRKVEIQGLGLLNVERGTAQCQ